MRSRYNRGNGDSALLKLLIFVIAVPSVFAMVFGLFNSTSAPAANPSPPAVPPPTQIGAPGLALCNPKQLSDHGKAPSAQGAEVLYSGEMADQSGVFAKAVCWLSRKRKCDVTWQSRVMYLCTEHGGLISALEYVEGSVGIGDQLTGPRYTQDMKLCQGSQCSPFDIVNPRFNCHGDSFGHDEYWIQNPEVATILADDYTTVAVPEVGDIVIYRESPVAAGDSPQQHCAQHATTGEIVHSATWVGPRTLDMTFGKRGFEPRKRYMPVGPGEDAAWDNPNACVTYYRRKSV